MKKEIQQLSVAHALGSYMPRTYTWVYNQLRFLPNTKITILCNSLHPDRFMFNVNNLEIYAFPKIDVLNEPTLTQRICRRLLRLVLIDSRFDLLMFALKAKRMKCALIHAHFANIGWKYIPVARMLKIPLVVSFYGYDYDFLPNTVPIWKRRYRDLFQHATLFLTEGEYGRRKLIEKGAPVEKVIVHHLGVDVDQIPHRLRDKRLDEPIRLVQVASLVPKKGHKFILEALKIIKEKGMIENVTLTIIGNGPLKDDLIHLTKQYELDSYVKFVEHIAYHDLHNELLKYDVFIHPSITTLEGDCEGGAPVVLLDAQATGMPVISTLHCDIPEEVNSGTTGLLVPEGDFKALSDAILLFIKNQGILVQYASSGRKTVEKNYSAKKQANILYDIYKKGLANGI